MRSKAAALPPHSKGPGNLLASSRGSRVPAL